MMLTLEAPAKVNLTLEVMGKRADGFHEVRTMLQTIDLADTLTFEPAEDIMLECGEPSLAGPDNLVLRAAHLLRERTEVTVGARIILRKVIPSAAGLGGGSSDAACTLLALNRLWELGLSLAELEQVAGVLGSDVPFFLTGGTALAEGRGERIRSVPELQTSWLVILAPEIEIPRKTATMYSLLTPGLMTDGSLTERAVQALEREGVIPPGLLFNVFDDVAFTAFPELARWRNLMLEAGAEHAHLAGAGPSLFCMLPSKAEAQRVAGALRGRGAPCFVVNTLGRRNDGGLRLR